MSNVVLVPGQLWQDAEVTAVVMLAQGRTALYNVQDGSRVMLSPSAKLAWSPPPVKPKAGEVWEDEHGVPVWICLLSAVNGVFLNADELVTVAAFSQNPRQLERNRLVRKLWPL